MNRTEALESAAWDALRQVVDPEIDCNVVDLGLIYDLRVADGAAVVQMTLTTPNCPMQKSLAEGVRAALLELEGIDRADVALVWDPPWAPSMMTEKGRRATGIR